MPLKALIKSLTLLLWYQLSSNIKIVHLDVFEEGITVSNIYTPPCDSLSISQKFFGVVRYLEVVLLVQ